MTSHQGQDGQSIKNLVQRNIYTIKKTTCHTTKMMMPWFQIRRQKCTTVIIVDQIQLTYMVEYNTVDLLVWMGSVKNRFYTFHPVNL